MASRRTRTDRPRSKEMSPSSDSPQRAFAVDVLARDPQLAVGLVTVAAGFSQYRKNVPPFDLGQAVAAGAGCFDDNATEIVGKGSENHGAFDQVAQLACIARPVVFR